MSGLIHQFTKSPTMVGAYKAGWHIRIERLMVPGDMDRIGRRMAKRVHLVAFCIACRSAPARPSA